MPPLLVLLGTLLALAAAPGDTRALALALLLPVVGGLQGSRRARRATAGAGGKTVGAGRDARRGGPAPTPPPPFDELLAAVRRTADREAEQALLRHWVREVSPPA